MSEGQTSFALPPTFIIWSPSVQHLMTPFSGKVAGSPRCTELSNTVPSVSLPVECTLTVSAAVGAPPPRRPRGPKSIPVVSFASAVGSFFCSQFTVHRSAGRPSGGRREGCEAGAQPRVAGRPARRSALVLERHLHLGAIGAHLALLELHVELGDFGDAEIAQRLRGALDSGLGCLFPGVGAGADQLDDLVHALRHGWLLSGLLGGGALRGGGFHSASSPPRTARPRLCPRRCTW